MTGGLFISRSSMRLACSEAQRCAIEMEMTDMVAAAIAELEELPIEGTQALQAVVEMLAGGLTLQAEAQARNAGARQ